MKILSKTLESWVNTPIIFEGHNSTLHGQIQIGIREITHNFNCLASLKTIIPTTRKGIPVEFLIKAQKHYESAYSIFKNGEARRADEIDRRYLYSDLSSDMIIPKIWFVDERGNPIKLLTTNLNRKKDKLYGIAFDDNHFCNFFYRKHLCLYTISKN